MHMLYTPNRLAAALAFVLFGGSATAQSVEFSSISAVKIRTLDMERAIAFYEKVLGMQVVARTDNPYPPARLVKKDMEGGGRSIETQLKFGNSVEEAKASKGIGVVLRTLPGVKEPYKPRADDPLMVVSVKDIDAAERRITENGYKPYIAPFEFAPGIRILFVLDPSGNDIEIVNHP
jgi:catechol 2,3-dioxygenase-like lactoylglutathione lyase family enzyme